MAGECSFCKYATRILTRHYVHISLSYICPTLEGSQPMPTLHITSFIAAPVERVFELGRSVDLHKLAMRDTQDRPIAGNTSGLLNQNDFVIWEGKHFKKLRRFKMRITAMNAPHSFTNQMVDGALKAMRHEVHFKPCTNGTIMIDLFEFESYGGLLGKAVNTIFLTPYIRRLLETRNAFIRNYAESPKWKAMLDGKSTLV